MPKKKAFEGRLGLPKKFKEKRGGQAKKEKWLAFGGGHPQKNILRGVV